MNISPSIHKDNSRYTPVEGCNFNPDINDGIVDFLDKLFKKHDQEYPTPTSTNSVSGKASIYQDIFRVNEPFIYEGERWTKLRSKIPSLLIQLRPIMPLDDIKQVVLYYNQKYCKPPYPINELETIWTNAVKFIDEKGKTKYPELSGNAYYQINEKPEKYIIAYKQKNQLIETTAKPREKQEGGIKIIEYYLYHNKTYLACIPVKIVRHKNPLTFLDDLAKYSISFVDAAGEHYTLAHKTLSEILSGLKDLGYVLNDGAEGALSAMVQAYKERKEIEDNEDMDYLGFFTDNDNKIIASNIQIKNPVISSLNNSLLFIEELKQYFETRLDLLSTSITWGMVAPIVFMLKTNNYFLKWLHFYGFPNATKSNTGKIVLAIDGHHDNPDFLLNLSRIDTIARLGDVVSHTTFPKLVDEVDLNGKEKEWLVNALKSAIESRIVRSKFMRNNSTTSTGIPALSPLILTSNPPPPFHDSGYMRRIIERNFPKSETWKESDPVAVQFKEFLRVNLKRLKALGDFRNWYIMNNQAEILDEARFPPLDLGLKILSEAYKAAGRAMPGWLTQRLPEDQLEESIEDNSVIVKRAFEKYITEEFSRALSFWRLQEDKPALSKDISDRFVKLAKSNLLPDVKPKNYGLIIRKGILQELYKHGVTRDQLPNLKALADYMKATYRKTDGNKIIDANFAQLNSYFDKIEEVGEGN